MRAKSIAIFLTVVVALIGVSLYQVDRGVFSDQISQGEGAARSQIAALVPAFQGEFKSINEHFKIVAPQVLGRNADFSDAISNRFEMVARLLQNDGTWTIQQRAFHDKAGRVKTWAENYSQVALKSVKPKDIPLGGTALVVLLDPQRRPFFLWILRDEKDQWSAAITKTDIFQAIIDRQRGQSTAIFLVNKSGQALGHTTADYVGSILKDDPIVAEILRSNKRQGVGLFKDAKGDDLQGLYEQIPGSNVLVVLSRPLNLLRDNRANLRWQILLMGGGLALVGLAAILLTIKDPPPNRAPLHSGFIPSSPSPSSGAAPPPTITASTASVPSSSANPDLAREKMKAYTVSASALAREMHGPLTRILSQAQLLKAKGIAAEEVQRIEELARAGRGVVLKLLSFAGEEEFRAEPTSINEVINRTIGIFESKFQSKGIKVEKNLKRMPEIAAHPLALMKILEALFNNAIEAMERMPSKNLLLTLDAEGSAVVLKIKDSGEGISNEKVAQVFDPFFTTKNPSQHSGLGLSTAYGLVREFGGELQFQSQPGQGATVIMKFPIGIAAPAVGPTMDPPKSARAPVSTKLGLPNFDDLQLTQVPLPPQFSRSTTNNDVPAGKPFSTPQPVAPQQAMQQSAAPGIPQPPAPRTRPRSMGIPQIEPTHGDFDLEIAGELAPPGAGARAPNPLTPPNKPTDQPATPTATNGQHHAGSLIQDQAIEDTLSMIDQFDVGPAKPLAPPKPGPSAHPEASAFGKIDKPQFGPKKPPPRGLASQVTIRKPGERK